jgi:hypothetical protein
MSVRPRSHRARAFRAELRCRAAVIVLFAAARRASRNRSGRSAIARTPPSIRARDASSSHLQCPRWSAVARPAMSSRSSAPRRRPMPRQSPSLAPSHTMSRSGRIRAPNRQSSEASAPPIATATLCSRGRRQKM